MTRVRRPNVTAQEKVVILREVLVEHRPVSEVCERHRLQPSQYCTWQKQLVETGAAAFDLDVPEMIALRRGLVAETKRYHLIGMSVLDDRWLDPRRRRYVRARLSVSARTRRASI